MLNASGGLLDAANAQAVAKYLQQHGGGGQDSSTPSTVPSIIPDPAVYQGETAQALQAYQNALAAISARRSNTLQNYGMTAKVDASGHLTSYGIDPNNQYGQIQQLLGQEGSTLDAARQASDARGIGQTGLGAQAAMRARLAGGLAQQNLGRAFVGEIGQEAADQAGARSAYSAAQVQAQRDAITSAIQNSWFTPAPQSSTGTQPPAGTSTTNPQAAKLSKYIATRTRPTYQRTSLARNMGVGL